jgi:hypothetical protein
MPPIDSTATAPLPHTQLAPHPQEDAVVKLTSAELKKKYNLSGGFAPYWRNRASRLRDGEAALRADPLPGRGRALGHYDVDVEAIVAGHESEWPGSGRPARPLSTLQARKQKALRFLRVLLADGRPVAVVDVMAKAKKEGVSRRHVYWAAKNLGVQLLSPKRARLKFANGTCMGDDAPDYRPAVEVKRRTKLSLPLLGYLARTKVIRSEPADGPHRTNYSLKDARRYQLARKHKSLKGFWYLPLSADGDIPESPAQPDTAAPAANGNGPMGQGVTPSQGNGPAAPLERHAEVVQPPAPAERGTSVGRPARAEHGPTTDAARHVPAEQHGEGSSMRRHAGGRPPRAHSAEIKRLSYEGYRAGDKLSAVRRRIENPYPGEAPKQDGHVTTLAKRYAEENGKPDPSAERENNMQKGHFSKASAAVCSSGAHKLDS